MYSAMFRACPALLQSDSMEDLELKALSSFDAKNPRLTCHAEFVPFCFFHILPERISWTRLDSCCADPRNPGTGPHGRMFIPMLMSKNTVDAADMSLATFQWPASRQMPCRVWISGMENAIVPSVGSQLLLGRSAVATALT
jgi:hypothetical protein